MKRKWIISAALGILILFSAVILLNRPKQLLKNINSVTIFLSEDREMADSEYEEAVIALLKDITFKRDFFGQARFQRDESTIDILIDADEYSSQYELVIQPEQNRYYMIDSSSGTKVYRIVETDLVSELENLFQP
ncbi:MAG: hypothetical protein PUB22_08945 [Clostridiales bacterium]|nr:hypothetical protein [Clostridiales bacterium]